MRECPSKRVYIATDVGGYVSASDEENEFALAIDTTTGKIEDSPDNANEVIDSVACTTNYQSILVQ
jgi:frataxin-like iron-binding protein CyaY